MGNRKAPIPPPPTEVGYKPDPPLPPPTMIYDPMYSHCRPVPVARKPLPPPNVRRRHTLMGVKIDPTDPSKSEPKFKQGDLVYHRASYQRGIIVETLYKNAPKVYLDFTGKYIVSMGMGQEVEVEEYLLKIANEVEEG